MDHLHALDGSEAETDLVVVHNGGTTLEELITLIMEKSQIITEQNRLLGAVES